MLSFVLREFYEKASSNEVDAFFISMNGGNVENVEADFRRLIAALIDVYTKLSEKVDNFRLDTIIF